MSASIDQRSKGTANQVSNGPGGKETVKDGEFEAYFQNQPPQGTYPAAPPMSTANVTDPYSMPNYYSPMSFPYGLNQGGLGNDANAWSNGGDSMAFLGSTYGQMGNEYMAGGGGGLFQYDYGQPAFGWGFSEYSAWGNGASQGRKDGAYDDYYAHPDSMGASESYNVNGDLDSESNVKGVEQGLQGMTLDGVPEDASSVPVGLDNSAAPVSSDLNSGVSATTSGNSAPVSTAPKKMTWASVASQPAKPQPALKPKSIPRAPVPPNKQNMDIGTWDTANKQKQNAQQQRGAWNAPRGRSQAYSTPGTTNSPLSNSGNAGLASISAPAPTENNPVLDKLRSANQYNPKSVDIPKNVRFFIIKSYSEDDIHRSIKYSIWCSTESGNKRLDAAFQSQEKDGGVVYLLFSVNGSGHFCGVAQMMCRVDYSTNTGVWAQDKWKGKFEVKWIYVKDVPNSQLRHIRLENNENKPVTNSRDTQEVFSDKGKVVLKIIQQYRHTTSIFDDFGHYEKRQEEDQGTKPKSAGRKQ